MRRFQLPSGISFAVAIFVAGTSVLVGCGGDGGGGRKDGGADGKRDVPGVRLDGGAIDGGVDRSVEVLPHEAGTSPDGTATNPDLGLGADLTMTVVDGDSDQAVPPLADAPAALPDATPQGDPDLPVLPAEAGPTADAIPAVDMPSRDVPLGEDGPVITVDGQLEDVPLLLRDTLGLETEPAIDAPAVDGTELDAAPVDGPGPGVVVGWPTDIFDFGINPCGGEAPASQTFTLTNTGASPVTLAKAKFTGTSGYSSDAQGKTIAAGGTLLVTLHAPGIPQTSAIPSTYNDILTLETDIAGDDQHLIRVSQAAKGAVLGWSTVPGFGSFEPLAPGFSSNAAFQVVNTGNLPAQVALVATAPFSVTSDSPVTITAGTAADGTVTFTPSTGGSAAGTLAMGLASPVALCQPLPSALGLTGTSINGAISLSAASLSFATECHATAASQTLTVTNTGVLPMTWSATLEAGQLSVFQLAPSTSTLTPQDGSPAPSTVVTVTPSSPTNATPTTDTISITTDAIGDTVHKVVLTQTPLGDVISTLADGPIDLGAVPIAAPALTSPPVTVTVRNAANTNSLPAVVTLQMTGPSAAYFAVTPTEVTLAPGGQAEVSVTFSPGTSSAIITTGNHIDLTANLHWQVGVEANCGAASGDVAATGTATLAQVSGIPGQLDFELVNCGASALQKQITVTNSGTAAGQITSIEVDNPTYYAVDYPTLPKALAPGGSALITVTPNAIPATVPRVPDLDTYSGSLTITTDAIGDHPHQVALRMGAEGAIISNPPWPTDWSFGTTRGLEILKLYVPVVNDGNVPASATLEGIIVAQEQHDVFSLANQSTLQAGQTSNIVAQFQPNDTGLTFTATANLLLSVPTGKVFCQPLPAGWNSTAHNIHMQGQSASTPTH
jgi:hypothetical protein